MPDRNISQWTELTSGNIADTDHAVVYDIDGGAGDKTKRTLWSSVYAYILAKWVAVYDPTAISSDAFDMANFIVGSDATIVSAFNITLESTTPTNGFVKLKSLNAIIEAKGDIAEMLAFGGSDTGMFQATTAKVSMEYSSNPGAAGGSLSRLETGGFFLDYWVSQGVAAEINVFRIDGDGNIVTVGTVDGRNIATDGTKLDGIEAGATADQTSIVGINGTKAQFDTAVTDGDILYVGDAVTAVTGGTGITSSGGLTPDITLNVAELGVATMVTGDWIVFDNAGVSNKALISAIPLSIFNNDLGVGSPPFTDDNSIVEELADPTKELRFDLGGNTTAIIGVIATIFTTAKTVTIPDATDTLVGKATTDTLTNKTIDADGTGNVLTNIGSSEIKSEIITGFGTEVPVSGDFILFSDTGDSGNLKKADASNFLGGGGEVNTMSNSGTGGIAIFEAKSGVDFPMRSLISDSGDIIVALDGANDNIDFSIGTGVVTNAKMADMAAYTIRLRNAGTTGVGADVKISGLTEEVSPAALDWVLGEDAAGNLRKYDVGNLPAGGGGEANTMSNSGTGGIAIFEPKSGVDFPMRSLISDSGDIVVALDAPNDNIDFSIAAFSTVTAAPADKILIEDASDSGNHKVVLAHFDTRPTSVLIDINASSVIDCALGERQHDTLTANREISAVNNLQDTILDFDGAFTIDFSAAIKADPDNEFFGNSSLVAGQSYVVIQKKELNGGMIITYVNGAVDPLPNDFVTNANLQDVGAYTIKLRNAGTVGVTADVKISALTEEVSPAALDWILGEDAAGNLRKYDVGNLPGSSPPFTDDNSIVEELADPTKELRFDLGGNTTAIIGVIATIFTTAKTVTIPDATDTLVGKATTDTLTNKTFDADGTGNVLTNIGSSEIKSEIITGQSTVTAASGDFLLLSDTGDSGNLKKIDALDFLGGASPPFTDDNSIVEELADPTKELRFDLGGNTTAIIGVIATIFTTAKTITIPDATDTLVGKATTDVFTNKTIDADAAGNVLTNIGSSEIKSEIITGFGTIVPVSGDFILFSDTSDAGNLKKADASNFLGGGGNVATDTIWDVAGDLVYGTGSDAAVRLAIGTFGQVLSPNSGATAPEWTSIPRITGVDDVNGNEVVRFLSVASALNYLEISNSATGNNVVFDTEGGNANIGISFNTKGTGFILFRPNGATEMQVEPGKVRAATVGGYRLMNETASATNPTLIPNGTEEDTGLGWAASDSPSIIGGGLEIARFIGVASAVNRIEFSNAATGARAIIQAEGEATVGINYRTKGIESHVFTVNAINVISVDSTGIRANLANGPKLLNSAASGTVPTLIPERSDINAGWGAQAAGNLSAITNSLERVRITDTEMLMVSGNFNINGNSIINTGTLTLPTSTDTLVGKATTDAFTNKTIDADGTGNVLTNIGSSEIKSEIITGLTLVTAALGDSLMISDVGDSGNLKEVTVQTINEAAEFWYSLPMSDYATAITTGTKWAHHFPFAATIIDVKASCDTAPTDATMIIDLHLEGTTIMTTNKINIDTGEDHSDDAATQPTLTTTAISLNDKMEFIFDQVGSTIAGAGVTVHFLLTSP